MYDDPNPCLPSPPFLRHLSSSPFPSSSHPPNTPTPSPSQISEALSVSPYGFVAQNVYSVIESEASESFVNSVPFLFFHRFSPQKRSFRLQLACEQKTGLLGSVVRAHVGVPMTVTWWWVINWLIEWLTYWHHLCLWTNDRLLGECCPDARRRANDGNLMLKDLMIE